MNKRGFINTEHSEEELQGPKKKIKVFQLNTDGDDLSLIQNKDRHIEPVQPPAETSENVVDLEEIQPAETAIEPVTDPLSRRKLIMTIKLYAEWFREKLSKINIASLEELEEEALRNLLEEIKFIIRANNSCTFNYAACKGFIGLFERIGCSSGYKLEGLSSLVDTDENMKDIIKEISLEFAESNWTTVSPYMRGCYLLGATMFSLHNSRVHIAEASKLAGKVLSSDFVQKWSHL